MFSRSLLLAPLLLASSLLSFPEVIADPPPPQASGPGAQAAQAGRSGRASAESYYLFMMGRQREAEDDTEGAIALYQKAAEVDPSSGEILAELAGLYARQGRPREAIATAEQALRTAPDTTEAHFVLGSIYAAYAQTQELPRGGSVKRAAGGDYAAKAIEHLLAVQQARGNTADASLMLTLGRLYLQTRAFDDAVAALTKFIEQEPLAVEGIALLGQAYAEAGRLDEATKVLEAAARRDSSFYPALGDLYERAGRWQQAADAFRRASEHGTQSAEVKKRWALALLNSERQGDPAKARDLLQQVVEANPSDPRALYLLAQAQRQVGELAAAEASARRLIATDPQGASGPFALAQVYEQRHEYRKVADTLQPVVERLSAHTPADRTVDLVPLLLHLAFAYIDLAEPDRAIEALDRAREMAPDNADVAAARVQAHLAAHRYRAALDAALEARRRHPGDVQIARLEAEALRRNDRMDEAAAVLEKLREAHPDDVTNYVALAELLMNGGRIDQASAVLQQAQALFPNDVTVLFELGAMRERQRRWAEAEDAFRRVIARDPRHAPALNYLGFMLADRGLRLAESVEYIRRALEVEPNNPAYLDSLGWAYFKMNRLDLAETPLREAASQRTTDSAVQEHWGDVLVKLGRRSEAIAAWRRALAGDGEQIDRAAIEAKIRSAEGSARR